MIVIDVTLQGKVARLIHFIVIVTISIGVHHSVFAVAVSAHLRCINLHAEVLMRESLTNAHNEVAHFMSDDVGRAFSNADTCLPYGGFHLADGEVVLHSRLCPVVLVVMHQDV